MTARIPMARRGRSVRLATLTALALCVLPGRSSAWNGRGHMIIAAIAYDRLDPGVRARVDELVRLNPEYASWVRGSEGALRGKVAFMRAATWPDLIKNATGYVNDGNQPSGPSSSRNTGYDDNLQHRYWHYIDVPFSTDGTPLEYPASPNVVTQIEAFRETLASPGAPDELKSYELVWLVHLVGDVHQPLHVASRFSRDFPHGDLGGNKVRLCAAPCRSELHALWDGILGSSESVALAMKAAKDLGAGSRAGSDDLADGDWVAESLAIARKAVYVEPIGPGAGPYTVTRAYRQSARATARERVTLAGARLALVLNKELK